MRLPSDRRVRKRPEFQDLAARGVRVATEHFVLIAATQAGGTHPSRLGVTASRKVGNAVVRNRLKRLVREAFRQLAGVLPDGHDLLVICRYAGALGTRDVVEEWSRARPRLLKLIDTVGGPGSPKRTRSPKTPKSASEKPS